MAPPRTLAFLDASVLVAASRSPSGGSALTLEVCQGRTFRGAVTSRVLLEARVNIAAKFGEAELLTYYRQLASVRPEVVPPPSEARIRQAALLTSEKDAHVLAAALACKAGWLVTLDRKHLLTPAVQSANLPLRAGTPGDFLQAILNKS